MKTLTPRAADKYHDAFNSLPAIVYAGSQHDLPSAKALELLRTEPCHIYEQCLVEELVLQSCWWSLSFVLNCSSSRIDVVGRANDQ